MRCPPPPRPPPTRWWPWPTVACSADCAFRRAPPMRETAWKRNHRAGGSPSRVGWRSGRLLPLQPLTPTWTIAWPAGVARQSARREWSTAPCSACNALDNGCDAAPAACSGWPGHWRHGRECWPPCFAHTDGYSPCCRPRCAGCRDRLPLRAAAVPPHRREKKRRPPRVKTQDPCGAPQLPLPHHWPTPRPWHCSQAAWGAVSRPRCEPGSPGYVLRWATASWTPRARPVAGRCTTTRAMATRRGAWRLTTAARCPTLTTC